MKFIRAGVIQFDLFPRNCELTSAFENSASLIGKSTLCHSVLTRSKNRVFSFHREDIAPFFFLFDRTVCSCAKGHRENCGLFYFCQSSIIPFLSHRFLILCRIPFNPIKSLGFFSSRCQKLSGNTVLLMEFLFLRQYCLSSLPHLRIQTPGNVNINLNSSQGITPKNKHVSSVISNLLKMCYIKEIFWITFKECNVDCGHLSISFS